jgi:hypothetical protein
MGFDWQDWMKGQKLKIKSKQEELKKLKDDELMQLHNAIWDSFESSLQKGESQLPDSVTAAAVYNEVQRRGWAACWPWKRWLRPNECRKWLEHIKKTEEKAKHWSKDWLEAYHKSANQS